MSLQELETEALKLDLDGRAALAERLLRSLDELKESENEMLWAKEAQRRFEEMRSGAVVGRPAEDVLRDARAKLT